MPASPSRKSAFTLVEMLLVIVVITIATLVTIPTLKNSIRGSRLKSAARTVISSGRYARSMAVLKQQPVQVSFPIGQSVVTVTPVVSGTPRLMTSTSSASESDTDEAGDETNVVVTTGATGNETLRRTMERVTIVEVTREDDGSGTTITYGTNGRCPEYRVKLQDEHGSTMVIHVDALATARTENIE